MDKSFGYNRASEPGDFLTHDELIHSLVDITSKNGNLLLNVGPRGEDAQIPDVQLQRLEWLGAWLERNGEAIHGTRPWQRAEGETREGPAVRFTQRDGRVYATVLGSGASGAVTLQSLPVGRDLRVDLLGHGPVEATPDGDDLRIQLPPQQAMSPAFSLRIQGLGSD
jgi:alpha-L-fucosidase